MPRTNQQAPPRGRYYATLVLSEEEERRRLSSGGGGSTVTASPSVTTLNHVHPARPRVSPARESPGSAAVGPYYARRYPVSKPAVYAQTDGPRAPVRGGRTLTYQPRVHHHSAVIPTRPATRLIETPSYTGGGSSVGTSSGSSSSSSLTSTSRMSTMSSGGGVVKKAPSMAVGYPDSGVSPKISDLSISTRMGSEASKRPRHPGVTNVFITGKPGVGKTTLMAWVVDQLTAGYPVANVPPIREYVSPSTMPNPTNSVLLSVSNPAHTTSTAPVFHAPVSIITPDSSSASSSTKKTRSGSSSSTMSGRSTVTVTDSVLSKSEDRESTKIAMVKKGVSMDEDSEIIIHDDEPTTSLNLHGFISVELRESGGRYRVGQRIGFDLISVVDPNERYPLARMAAVRGRGTRTVGKYTIVVSEMERSLLKLIKPASKKMIAESDELAARERAKRMGVSSLSDLSNPAVITDTKSQAKTMVSKHRTRDVCVIDEIGKMELFSRRFQQEVQTLVDSPSMIVFASIPIAHRSHFISKLREREDATLFSLTETNRGYLRFDVLEELTGIIEQARKEV